MPSDMLVSVLMDTFVIRDLGDLLRVTKGHIANNIQFILDWYQNWHIRR